MSERITDASRLTGGDLDVRVRKDTIPSTPILDWIITLMVWLFWLAIGFVIGVTR